MSAPYRQRWGFVLLYMVFLFQENLLCFLKSIRTEDGKRDTKKDSLSRRKSYPNIHYVPRGIGNFSLMKKPLYSEWFLYFYFLKITIKIAEATAIKKNTESTFG